MLDARALLRKYDLRAKKSWGQNFLIDEKTFSSIVDAARITDGDWVVEIGAGLGTLTDRLAAKATRVVAVERDRDMCEVLREELGASPVVEIAEANALTFDYAAVARRAGRRLAVVGNLPYQIASPILFRLLEPQTRPFVQRIIVMLQREMAERIVARPGTKEYGALSVMLRLYGRSKIVHRVAAGCFIPAPRVGSAVLAVELGDDGRLLADAHDEAGFSRVVHAAFQQRRKTLRNALRAIAPDALVDAALHNAGVDGQRRGETLDEHEFARLANRLL